MKMMVLVVLMMTLTVMTTGCKTSKRKDADEQKFKLSLNQERSLLRAASDNSLTLYLDQVTTAEKAEQHRLRAQGIAVQVLAFLQNGSAAQLTQGELRVQLVRLVPDEYRTLLDQLLGAVSPLHLDVGEKIGVNNVRRLEAVCLGIAQGTAQYNLKDRVR